MEISRAVEYDTYGDPSVLELRNTLIPKPGQAEVLVRVYASGLNPKDEVIRSGQFKVFSGRRFPKRTGFDFAGEVHEVGVGVTEVKIGQKVWGLLDGFGGGTAAEYVVVRKGWLSPMPPSIGYSEAAVLPLVGLTALQALREADLKKNERLLIKGASGGVGSAAIGLAKLMGAHVTAVASTGSLEHCRSLGADEVVDYTQTDPATLKQTFDVFFDCYGNSPYFRYHRLLKKGGRFVTIAPHPSFFFSQLVARLFGLPRASFVSVKSKCNDLKVLANYVEQGLRMPIEASYPLEQVREAHVALKERHARGKRVLIIESLPKT
jgi:NADPH:quinone reductase-like Zn-dependent oxidoreductase